MESREEEKNQLKIKQPIYVDLATKTLKIASVANIRLGFRYYEEHLSTNYKIYIYFTFLAVAGLANFPAFTGKEFLGR